MRKCWVTFGIASSEMSQANTVEDRMPVNQLLKMQLQPNAGHQDLEKQGVLIRAQSSSTLFENHLKYTEKAVRLYETEAVQLFVRGVQAKHRIPLGNKLEERDEWTWQAVMEEGYGMVEAEKKMKRRSGRHLNGSSQPW